MNELKLQELSTRLSKIEKQNLWMKTAGLLLILLVSILLIGGAAKKPGVAEELRAKKLLIIDSKGKERVFLGVRKNSLPLSTTDNNTKGRLEEEVALEFRSLNSKKQMDLCANKERSFLSFYDSKLTSRLFMSASDKQSDFSLRSPKDETKITDYPRIWLLTTDEHSVIAMYDLQEKLRANIVAGEKQSHLSLCGSDNLPRVRLVAEDLYSSLRLVDSGFNAYVDMKMDIAKQTSYLSLNDSTENKMVHIFANDKKGEIAVYDDKGKDKSLKPGL